MMALISDIHGNHSALKAVLAFLDQRNIKNIICLGDVGGYYSEINTCIEELKKREIPTIMGNHDWYLAHDENCPRSNSANDCLDYQRQVITAENLKWLKSLPSEGTYDGIRVVHGGWNDPIDEYMKPSEEYFKNIEGKFFASGHTHIPKIWIGNNKTYCNPGSVGQPRDGNPDASFALWDGKKFELMRVKYDIQEAQQKMAEAGFNDYYYRNLSKGLQIGR